jgi:hypothetical protein
VATIATCRTKNTREGGCYRDENHGHYSCNDMFQLTLIFSMSFLSRTEQYRQLNLQNRVSQVNSRQELEGVIARLRSQHHTRLLSTAQCQILQRPARRTLSREITTLHLAESRARCTPPHNLISGDRAEVLEIQIHWMMILKLSRMACFLHRLRVAIRMYNG